MFAQPKQSAFAVFRNRKSSSGRSAPEAASSGNETTKTPKSRKKRRSSGKFGAILQKISGSAEKKRKVDFAKSKEELRNGVPENSDNEVSGSLVIENAMGRDRRPLRSGKSQSAYNIPKQVEREGEGHQRMLKKTSVSDNNLAKLPQKKNVPMRSGSQRSQTGRPSIKKQQQTGRSTSKTSLTSVTKSEANSSSSSSRRDVDLPSMTDSFVDGRKLFETIIHPVTCKEFFENLWGRKPLLLKRHVSDYNDGWFSTADLDKILRDEKINFSEHLDVVSYRTGVRETHNPDGRAYAPVVWDYYQQGCSIRLLNPQTYSKPVWKVLSTLQEFFGSMVGANIYLTPPGTQGFAPHYDDIEAFILQLEGKKHWRLYRPRSDAEVLPRYSSANFRASDLDEPILDTVLEPGDLLYFPRGIIHQGNTLPDAHSMHITVSCMQLNTWGDLLLKAVPRALEVAMEEDVTFRQSLPHDYLNYMGLAFADKGGPKRQQFMRTLEQLMSKLTSHLPVDAACDQMGKRFMHDSLPPALTEDERKRSIHGSGEYWSSLHGRIKGATELDPDTEVKLIRRGCIRLVMEGEDNVQIYHNLENSRVYHQVEPQFIEISAEAAAVVEKLLLAYPDYVKVDELPQDDLQAKIEIASLLYDKGLLVTKYPLDPISDDSSSDSMETCSSTTDLRSKSSLV